MQELLVLINSELCLTFCLCVVLDGCMWCVCALCIYHTHTHIHTHMQLCDGTDVWKVSAIIVCVCTEGEADCFKRNNSALT